VTGTGLAETGKLSAILMLDGFTRSEAALATDVNATFRATGATPAQALEQYGRLLAQRTSPRPRQRVRFRPGLHPRRHRPRHLPQDLILISAR
jgi:hypothetical protein